MINLLSAGFSRMFKNRMFYICAAVMAVYGMMSALSANAEHLDDIFFEYCSLIPVLMSVFCAMFIGTEYSDGTMRNKLIAGHKRVVIYMSNFIISAAGLMMYAACIVACLGLGIPILGFFVGDINMIFARIGCSLVLLPAIAGIFTLISLLIKSKPASAVVSIILAFTMLIVAGLLYSLLLEPEYYRDYEIESVYTYGEEKIYIPTEDVKLVPNPFYVSGVKRQVYQFILDFTPGGQTVEIVSGNMSPPLLLAGYSMIIAAATTAAGLLVFSRKNLN